eukprot:1010853-Rhodomonas_salina.1
MILWHETATNQSCRALGLCEASACGPAPRVLRARTAASCPRPRASLFPAPGTAHSLSLASRSGRGFRDSKST